MFWLIWFAFMSIKSAESRLKNSYIWDTFFCLKFHSGLCKSVRSINDDDDFRLIDNGCKFPPSNSYRINKFSLFYLFAFLVNINQLN